MKRQKEISDLDWVRLACSKDISRYNLVEVYRDKNTLVATDGYRMHLSNSLPDMAPHYLSGLDAEFPDYTQIMPKGPSVFLTLTSDLTEWLVQALTIADKMYTELSGKKYQWGVTIRGTRHENGTGTVSLNAKLNGFVLDCSHTSPGDGGVDVPFNVGLNPRYLLDVIKYGTVFTFASDHINTKQMLSSVKIDICSTPRSAIVMPIRLS